MSTKENIINGIDKKVMLNDEKVKSLEKDAKLREKFLNEFLDERLDDQDLVRLYDDDKEEFMKKITKSFKVALSKKKLLKEVEGDVYLLFASVPFDYFIKLKGDQLALIAKKRKELGKEADEYLINNGFIDEQGQLLDMREKFKTGTINKGFGYPFKANTAYMCNIGTIFHDPKNKETPWRVFSSTIGGDMSGDDEVCIKCDQCKQKCYTPVCENEVIDNKTRQMHKCKNIRTKFIWDQLVNMVGMKTTGSVTVGKDATGNDTTKLVLSKRFGNIYPIGYLSKEKQNEVDNLENEIEKNRTDKTKVKEVKELREKIKKIKKSVTTKDDIRKKIHEILDEKNFVKGCDFQTEYDAIPASDWKKGKWIVFEGYVVSIYTKENAIQEMTIICNDDSFDIDNMPDGFTGIRINVPTKLYEMSLKDKITEESEVMVFGQLNKFKEFYPSIRAFGIIVLDGVGKPEKIIQDVTAGFQSDFSKDVINENAEESEEKMEGTIDDYEEPDKTVNSDKEEESEEDTSEKEEDDDELDGDFNIEEKPSSKKKPVKDDDDFDDDIEDDEPKQKSKIQKSLPKKK